jgi:hypothetical protein
MNVFQLFAGSFYSSAAYRQMRASANFGMGYALFVVCVTTLFVMLYYGAPVYVVSFMGHEGKPALFDQVVRQISDQAPVMTLKSGTLATRDPKATTINIAGSYGKQDFDMPFITIDTTGDHTTENTGTPILVTNKELLIQSGNTWKPQSLIDLTKNGPDTIIINHAVADEIGTHFTNYIHEHLFEYFLILWFFFIVCLFVVSFFILLTLGLIGLAIGSLVRSPLSFAAAVGLASLSFTPVAVLDALLLTVIGYAAHVLTLLLAGTVTLYAAIKCSDPATPAAVQ